MTQGYSAVIAGAGDCRALLVRSDGSSLPLNVVHDAHDAGERPRVEAAGGFISSDGRVCGVLDLTRSLGDLRLKRSGLTCDPHVAAVALEPGRDVAIVLATDGVWGALPDDAIARTVLTRAAAGRSCTNRCSCCEFRRRWSC